MKESFASRMRKAMDIRNMKQADLVEKTGLGKSAISQYYSGKYEPKQKGIYLIAKALDVSESWLMGYDVPMERTSTKYPDNILKIETKKFPLLGTIAAGQPIFAEEQFESYVEAGTNIRADFCLKVKGDSMINARICDGDIVFIRKQPDVNDGETVLGKNKKAPFSGANRGETEGKGKRGKGYFSNAQNSYQPGMITSRQLHILSTCRPVFFSVISAAFRRASSSLGARTRC